jgi:acetyltransferase-like isoleucine patch superfamily enzyme
MPYHPMMEPPFYPSLTPHPAKGFGDVFMPVVVLKPERICVSPTARVDSFCKLEGGEGLYIGEHVHVASYCHLNVGGGQLLMEDGSSCGSHCVIVTGSGDYKAGVGCSAVSPDVVNTKSRVVLRRNATLYVGCVVRPGVTIGEGATVAMGSVVLCDVPPGELWGGNPARRLRPPAVVPMHTDPNGNKWCSCCHHSDIPCVCACHTTDRFVDSQAEWYDQELR